MLLWELDASLLELEERLGAEAAGRDRAALQAAGAGDRRAGAARWASIAISPSGRRSISRATSWTPRTCAKRAQAARASGHRGRVSRWRRRWRRAASWARAALLYDGLGGGGSGEAGARAAGGGDGARRRGDLAGDRHGLRDLAGWRCVVETREGDVVRARSAGTGERLRDAGFRAGRRASASSRPGRWRRSAAPPPAWPDDALVWEASDPYLYMRTTADGRVIIGGADEEDVDQTTGEGR